jgi:hypothetical protein
LIEFHRVYRNDFAKSSVAVDTVGADFLAREPAMSFLSSCS